MIEKQNVSLVSLKIAKWTMEIYNNYMMKKS